MADWAPIEGEDSGRWARISALFHDALAQPEPEWPTFLARACAGDDALREEVSALLAAHTDAAGSGFLATRNRSESATSGNTEERLTPRLAPGTSLGPYEVVGLLGRGGMAEVYAARDTRLDRSVALKILTPQLAADPRTREHFEREGRAISRLEHPHICRLYDIGSAAVEGADVPFLVMELLEGETLADRLAHGSLPEPDVVQVGCSWRWRCTTPTPIASSTAI